MVPCNYKVTAMIDEAQQAKGRERGNKKWLSIQTTERKATCFRDAVENEDKYQALDNLKQLFHHYSNALVTKETADGLEVRRANKVSVGAVYVGVGNV